MSFNDTISSQHQEELIAIRSGITLLQWRVGDIANEEYQANQHRFAFNYVCAAAGYFVGKSGATIQRWARVAAFYPQEWREKYDGLLSFEHYATAMQFRDWQERLEKAAYGGKLEEPQSVDQMNAQSYVEPMTPENFPQRPAAVVSFDTSVPQVQVVGAADNVDKALQAIDIMLTNLARIFHLSDSAHDKLNQALSLIREALVQREVA